MLTFPQATQSLARLQQMGHRHDVVVNGRKVSWRRFGQGSPLVLLHGGHGSWLHWARNVEFLSARHEVWAPDLPGYGDSDSPLSASLDDLVNATQVSLNSLVGEATHVRLVGFSFGALVAATLASARQRVSHLALLGPVGHGGIRRPRGALHSWRDLPTGSPDWWAAMRHNLLMHMLHEESIVDATALQLHSRACVATRFHSKTISRAGGLMQAIAGHTGALLLVWGEHDVTAAPGVIGPQLAALHPDCRVMVVPDAGHWVQYEQADRINSLLRDWMQ